MFTILGNHYLLPLDLKIVITQVYPFPARVLWSDNTPPRACWGVIELTSLPHTPNEIPGPNES